MRTPDTSLEVLTAGAGETVAVGAALARWLRDGDVLLLHGDLGAGKTTLVKGVASGLGVEAIVSSPTFGLVSEYETAPDAPIERLYHLDLYRLRDEDDLESIGFAELAAPSRGATVVEWPERAWGVLPERSLLIEIQHAGPERRWLRFNLLPDSAAWGDRRQELDRLLISAAP